MPWLQRGGIVGEHHRDHLGTRLATAAVAGTLPDLERGGWCGEEEN